MTRKGSIVMALAAACALAAVVPAQDPARGAPSFEEAAAATRQRLDDSLAELAVLRERILAEQLPLARQLSELEEELTAARQEYGERSRLLDGRTLDLSTLRTEIEAGTGEFSYLEGLLADYRRNFQARLHIAEIPRHRDALERAELAAEDPTRSQEESLLAQAAILETSIARLEDVLGGTRFAGNAVADGVVRHGQHVVVGPAAVFRADDGAAGGVEEQLSTEPTLAAFARPDDAAAAATLVAEGAGDFPLDPTLGDARKIEATHESFVEHVKLGGPVMIPIFALAGAASLLTLVKWVGLSLLRQPSRRRIAALLEAAGDGDGERARREVAAIRGPAGRMLAVGVEHLDEPRELVEEAMFEVLLAWRLRLLRFLPFIAICAAAAPLLGLLGTVTGIIDTFKMITVFGSGDVKTLSGGISEALITTKFGLIVAIPALLLHSFLSRKARRILDGMEAAALAFVNQLGRRQGAAAAARGAALECATVPDPALVRAQVGEILNDLLGPLVRGDLEGELLQIQPARQR